MRWIALVGALFAASPLAADVRGTVSIDLRDARLTAKLDADYVALQNEPSIKLLLNPAMDVRSVSCPVCGAFRVERKGDDPAEIQVELKKALEKGPGVAEAKIDYDRKTATVKFDPEKVSPAVLVKATTDAGFPATPHSSTP